MSTRLIGVNGLKHAGKDTLYGHLAELAQEAGERAVRRGFADKLKVMAAKALGFEGDDEELIAHMDDLKETGVIRVDWSFEAVGFVSGTMNAARELTGRKYLQLFGGKAREVFGDTFWIDQVLPNPSGSPYFGDPGFPDILQDQLSRRFERAEYAVVTDVRYPNEAERVLNLGGVVVEVLRPGLESDGDASEQPLPPELVTFTVNNDGTLDDLRSQAKSVLRLVNQ